MKRNGSVNERKGAEMEMGVEIKKVEMEMFIKQMLKWKGESEKVDLGKDIGKCRRGNGNVNGNWKNGSKKGNWQWKLEKMEKKIEVEMELEKWNVKRNVCVNES